MQEREIDLIDLITEILLHWRTIIVWMLVGGVMFGGVSYVHSVQNFKEQETLLEQQQDTTTELENLEGLLTPNEKYNVKAIINNEKLNEYYNQSLLMQIDATNVPRMELTYMVISDDYEKSYNIEKIYEDMFSCGLIEAISAGNNIPSAQLSELIALDDNSKNLLNSNVTAIKETDGKKDSFRVVIVHTTETECKAIAAKIQKYLQEQHSDIVQNVGQHELRLINQSFAYITDTELLNQQRLMLVNIMNSNTNIKSIQDNLSDSEKRYYKLLRENDNDKKEEQIEEVRLSTPTLKPKNIVLGMLIFAFAYTIYLFLNYIFNEKLRRADDLNLLCGIPQIGVIPQEKSKNKLFAFVDNWIMKIWNHNKRVFTRDEAIGLVVATLKIQMKKQELNTIYCVGGNMKKQSLRLAEQIKNILSREGISVNILDNILYNRETIEQLQDVKTAFLIEKIGESLYDDVVREKELLCRQGINILGFVIEE